MSTTNGYSDQTNPETPTTRPKKKRSFRKYLIVLWGCFVAGVLSIAFLFVAIANGLFGPLPTFVELESPKSSLASEVYARGGELLGKFFIVDRSNVSYEEIPAYMVDALISTEDARFHQHSGIDFRGLVRVMFKTVLGGQDAGGGSTITQQLAKNLFHNPDYSSLWGRVKQKLKEWVIAVMLEKSYTKEEIMTMYLNVVPFSNNAHGIKAASRVYFNTSPDSLSIQNAAVLVGMLKGSTKYNPRRNPKQSEERRNVVLSQMAKYGKITAAERDSIQAIPLNLDFRRMSHDEGSATYFREYLRSEMKKWATENVKVDQSNYDIHRDGLKIHTTIDATMQRYAEEAVATHMKTLQGQFDEAWGDRNPWDREADADLKKGAPFYGVNSLIYRAIKQSERYRHLKYDLRLDDEKIEKSFNTKRDMAIFSWNGEIDTTLTPIDSIKYYKRILTTGFMVMDPSNGHVLAWVGGLNYHHFQYDNVTPTSKRQVGSTFKPFVYTVAVQNGWSPCRRVPNSPVTFEDFDNWTPANAGSKWNGQMVTLKFGLAHSINRVTAYIMKQIRPQPVIDIARKMGIESHIDPYPSICLGTPDISVYEMVGAYSTFANKGFYSKPVTYTRIEDKNGNVIQTFPSSKVEVLNAQTAYAMISLLRGVTDNGTGVRLRYKYKFTGEIAGKTGTTNDHSDGWYMGMIPKLVAGVWVGGDEKAIRFESLRLGSGSNMALPIWAEFMTRVYADESLGITQEDRFEAPPYMNIELDCAKYVSPLPINPQTGTPIDTTQVKDDFDYNNQFDL